MGKKSKDYKNYCLDFCRDVLNGNNYIQRFKNMSDMKLKEYLTESALQEEKTLPEAKNKVIFNKIFLAFINGDTSITLPSKINKSTKLYQCPHSDTCVNGSKLRGVCKIGLCFKKKCKAYDEIISYSETLN